MLQIRRIDVMVHDHSIHAVFPEHTDVLALLLLVCHIEDRGFLRLLRLFVRAFGLLRFSGRGVI